MSAYLTALRPTKLAFDTAPPAAFLDTGPSKSASMCPDGMPGYSSPCEVQQKPFKKDGLQEKRRADGWLLCGSRTSPVLVFVHIHYTPPHVQHLLGRAQRNNKTYTLARGNNSILVHTQIDQTYCCCHAGNIRENFSRHGLFQCLLRARNVARLVDLQSIMSDNTTRTDRILAIKIQVCSMF